MLQGLASGNLVNNKNPKVGSLFASDSSEPKMIFRFFCQFFGVMQKLAYYSLQTILIQFFFRKCDVNLNF